MTTRRPGPEIRSVRTTGRGFIGTLLALPLARSAPAEIPESDEGEAVEGPLVLEYNYRIRGDGEPYQTSFHVLKRRRRGSR